MPQGLKLSEIKTNVFNIIENLQQLESLSNAPPTEFDAAQALRQSQDTTSWLSELEKLPCERIAGIQERRKRRRRKTKQQVRQQKSRARLEQKDPYPVLAPIPSSLPVEPQPAEHIALKKLQDASNILTTIDLMERLQKVRGGDDTLSEKLAPLRLVWRRIHQENQNATERKTEVNVHTQWDKVIFGSSSPVTEKKNPQEFLQRR